MEPGVVPHLTLKCLAFHATTSPNNTGFSVLHTACINGDLETLSIILNSSPSRLDTWIALSMKTSTQNPFLPEELVKNSQDSLKRQQILQMIKKAAGVDQPKSMIHAGAKSGNIHHMKILLQLGESVNSLSRDPEDKGATPLILASGHNKANIVEYLLSRGANPRITDSQFNMAIHTAASIGNVQSLSLLIASGSDVNVKGFRGKTPLHFAALHGQSDATRLLCENGAEMNARTAFGDTPLICAAKNPNSENMKILLNKGANVHDRNSIGYSALFYCSKSGYVHTAKLLLDSGCAINGRARLRDTPLIIACGIPGNKVMVDFLLRSRADINLCNRQGRQALHHSSDADITDLLLDARANIEATDLYGFTPLLFVCSSDNPHGNMDVAKMLVERGACVNAQQVLSLYTPLHNLCTHHDLDKDIVKLLLDKGACVNALDSEGETPLFSAVRNFDVDLIELLLENGASVNVQNNTHLTPVDICASSEDNSDEEAVIRLLKKYSN